MFEGLNTALDWDDKTPATQGLFITCADSLAADASFVTYHMLSLHLKAKRPVCLVSFTQILNHYTLVGRKLGLGLLPLESKGLFSFVDGLTHLTGPFWNTNNPDAGKPDPHNPYIFTLLQSETNKQPLLKTLFDLIGKAIEDMEQKRMKLQESSNGGGDDESGENNETAAILFDGLDSLLLVSGGLIQPSDIMVFLQSCRAFRQSPKSLSLQSYPFVYAAIHGDSTLSGVDTLVSQLKNQSDIFITAQGLSSGYSKDVHGQLLIFKSKKGLGVFSEPAVPSKYHYKILDSNVTFFAPGLSSAVL